MLGHDEFAGWAESVGCLGGRGACKDVQANINLCMDTGRPSKVFRDKTKNYGKNLHGQFLAAKTSTTGEPRRVVIHHVAGINVRDAATMCVALE